MGTEESPTRVLEVRSDNYLSRPIHYRKDSILLYGPKLPPDSKNSRDKYYEIVLHKPFTESLHQMYRSVGHRLFLYSSTETVEDLLTYIITILINAAAKVIYCLKMYNVVILLFYICI